jgi:4a-hydroxytetrahydrobiopterin dehydratase
VEKLSAEEIARKTAELPRWRYEQNALNRSLRFREFMGAIDFINRVAQLAEALDHHPDLHLSYTRLTLVCSTHSAGGVTDKDFELAREIDRLFEAVGG